MREWNGLLVKALAPAEPCKNALLVPFRHEASVFDKMALTMFA